MSTESLIASKLVMIDCSDTLNDMISQDATTNPIALNVFKEELHTDTKHCALTESKNNNNNF